MTRHTRVCSILIAVLGAASAVPGWGQTGPAKKRVLPDLDVREQASSRASAAVELRRANIESFLSRERAARPGLRVVPNRFGLPKMMLRDGGTLSGASTLEPEENARNFLRANSPVFLLAPAEVDSLRLIVKDVTPTATFVAFNQTLDGIDVFNGQIKVTLTQSGEVVQAAAADVIPELRVSTKPRLSPEEGVLAALRAAGSKAASGATALARIVDPNGRVAFRNPQGGRFSPITSELVIFPVDADSARLAYRTFVDIDAQSYYEIVIDAESGSILFRHNLYTRAGQANVWLQSPLHGTRQLVTFPSGWLPASQNGSGGTGWVTTGNNADVYVDTDGNDKPDNNSGNGLQGGRAHASNGVFDFPFGDGGASLDPRNYKPASVSNLFYLINAAHDYYYGLGFTEQAGNFQTDNLGKGGSGNDAVLGEAQQGNETDNASFAPTPEGTAPRLRVGLETMGTSSLVDDLDYDYDSQTVVHEYGHGVSNRLVGAKISTSCLDGIQSGGMSEGWSDYFAISYSNNPLFGEYGPIASRRSYEGSTVTYEDVGKTGYEVHDDGEVWASTLWDLRKSLGQQVTDLLVINGLKSTPCNPSMTDARDAILAADQATNSGANRAKLWTVFARRGLGYSAAGVDGTGMTGTVYDAAYDQPTDLQTLKNPAITSKPLTVVASAGGAYSYTVTATNPNAGTLNFSLASGPDGMAVNPTTGKVTWVGTFTDQRVKITVTDGKGGKVVHGYELPVQTTLALGTPITISGTANSSGFANVTLPANVTVLQVTTRGGSGDADLWVTDPSGNDETSQRVGNNETLSYALPAAGRWQIEVDGYDDYSGITLTAAQVTPTVVGPNATVTGLTAIQGSETLYRITVPVGAAWIRVSTSGGTGDADLYLRKGEPALCQESLLVSQVCYYDYTSENAGNGESIIVQSPGAADYYVDISAYKTYSGLTLTTEVSIVATLVVSANNLAFSAVEGGSSPAALNLNLSNPLGGSYNWTAVAAAASGGTWLSIDKASGTGDAILKVSANTSGMKAGTYNGTVTVTAAGLAGSPQTIQVTLTITGTKPVPIITGVVHSASYQPGIVPASWVTIAGSNFTTVTDTWDSAVVNGVLPTQLDGVKVSIGGKAAYVSYVSPTQINAQVPDVGAGAMPVIVTNADGSSSAFTAAVVQTAPAFFLWVNKYAAATRQDYSLAAAPGTFAAPTVAAKPGEVLILWATGLGQTTPQVPAGIQVPADQLYAPSPVRVTIGTAEAQVYGAALAPGYAGLYQVAIQVPLSLADGEYTIQATVNGASSPDGVFLSVQH